MGHNETGLLSPSFVLLEPKDVTRMRIMATFATLLIKGGAISNSGDISVIGFEHLNIDDLSAEQKHILAARRTLTLRSFEAKTLLPNGETSSNARVHLISPGIINELGYVVGKHDGLRFWLQKPIDPNMKKWKRFVSIGCDGEVVEGLRNHAERILRGEGIIGDSFPDRTRYTTGILKELADTRGVGRIKPTLFNY